MPTFITQELAHAFLQQIYKDTQDSEDTSYEEFIEFVLESSDLFFPEVVYAAYVTQRSQDPEVIITLDNVATV